MSYDCKNKTYYADFIDKNGDDSDSGGLMDTNIFQTYAPSPVLKPFVKRFMFADCREDIHEIIYPKPTGYNYLTWQIDGHWRGDFGESFESSTDCFFFSGQIDGKMVQVVESGRFRNIVVEFTALGLYQITQLKGLDILNKVVGVSTLESSFSNELKDSLAGYSFTDQKIEYFIEKLEGFLVERVEEQFSVPEYLPAAITEIETNNGIIKLQDLYKSLCISERQFTRKFRELVGVAPKKFCKILQMNRLITVLLQEDRVCSSTLAVDLGYYDESHLIHTVNSFFEETPRKLLDSKQETVFAFLGESRI